VQLRVFVTSRSETPICLGFGDIPGTVHGDFVLHSIERSIVEHDISIFLKYELDEIKKEHALSTDWPGEQIIKLLTEKAQGLFIYAATACRFINNPKWPLEERLPLVLRGNAEGDSPTRDLDEMYTQILIHSAI
jgi:hypothetical protein